MPKCKWQWNGRRKGGQRVLTAAPLCAPNRQECCLLTAGRWSSGMWRIPSAGLKDHSASKEDYMVSSLGWKATASKKPALPAEARRPHGSRLLCIWPTFDTIRPPNSCLWSCFSELLIFSQRTLLLQFLLESCAWPHTISRGLFNLMNIQYLPLDFWKTDGQTAFAWCVWFYCSSELSPDLTAHFNESKTILFSGPNPSLSTPHQH